MEPSLFAEFCEHFTRHVNQLRIQQRSLPDAWRKELAKVEKQMAAIITAIKDGFYNSSMKAEMSTLEAQKAMLTDQLE